LGVVFDRHPQQGSTFGIPGVEEHAHFLRDVRHAEVIRNKLIDNIARAGVPGDERVTAG
jgi:NADH:ubiquinone reductase (non-electrogenic)